MFDINIKGEQITIREYQDGDEEKIVQLLRQTFGNHWSLEYWQWKYKQNPYGSLIFVAYNSQNELIGHIACQIMQGIEGGETRSFLYACDNIVTEKYRGNGISSIFIRLLPKDVLVFGFQNAKALSVTKKYEKEYSSPLHFFKIPIFSKKVTLGQRMRKSILKLTISSFEIKEVSDDNLLVLDSLWEKKKNELEESVVRDKKYILWRNYLNPNRMPVYAIHNKKDCVGYFSLSRRGSICYITDILLMDQWVSVPLISSIEKFITKLHTKDVTLISTDIKIQTTLLKSGYINQDSITMSIAVLTKKGTLPAHPYVTYADSDLF